MKGSTWGKWDLHIHTPFSIVGNYKSTEDVWEKFIQDLEKLPPEFSAIGINDYWFLNGYKEVINYKKKGRLKNINTIFPVCEFRIKKFAGVKFEKLKRVNLHIIFSPDISAELIQSQFLNTLEASYALDPEADSCTWSGVITEQSLIELGKQIRSKLPSDKPSNFTDLQLGFNNLNVDEKAIFTRLQSNSFLRDSWLSAIGKTEWGDLKWSESTISEKKDIINMSHFVLTCADSIDEYIKAKEALKTQGVRDLLLDCSDAHNFSDQKEANGKLVRERIGNSLTWIKGEPSFEGLKQILHEPKYRLRVSESKPREPLRKIDKLRLKFPPSTQIGRNTTKGRQNFCLAHITDDLHFSPYFTCLIGGRGTGKSTIINLIAERLGIVTEFFKQNNIYIEGSGRYDIQNDPSNLIEIQGTNEIEFVSQGRIESLTEGNELNRMIFSERILETNQTLKECQVELNEIISIIDLQIKQLFERNEHELDLTAKQKELLRNENVISSISDPTYIELSTQIKDLSHRKADIEASKRKYEELLSEIKEVIEATLLEPKLKNDYENRVSEIINHLRQLTEITPSDTGFELSLLTFDATENEILETDSALDDLKKHLNVFFELKGTSEESIKDATSANEKIAWIQNNIKEINQTIHTLGLKIQDGNIAIARLPQLHAKINKEIEQSLDTINLRLSHKSENVSPIRYDFNFDFERCKSDLFEEFYDIFKKDYHKPGTSLPSIREVLFLLEPTDVLDKTYSEFTMSLEALIDTERFNRTTNYVSIILNVFAKEINFEVYKLLVKKYIHSAINYLSIKGFYGPRPLEDCSFGQKCTAAIVTLLMSGVKPLIIDEPEAHLDNRLIADYLIDLIKEKKFDRQIIFATHNANFVINGDAELIHILEIPETDCFTRVLHTTIENTANRDSLLKLEGGRDAFEKREKKLLNKYLTSWP